MTLKTTAKERKTYPQFVFIVSVGKEVVESSWTTDSKLVNIFEMARNEVNRVRESSGTCTVWQKIDEVTSSGTPLYNRVFYATTNESFTKLEVTPSAPQEGFLTKQYRNFDSSKWRDNRLNPIKVITCAE
jgi:hypothetical protein